jgi:hypothetical protein
VVGLALRTYREEFRRVAGTAFVVFGVVGMADAIAVMVIDLQVARPLGAAIASTVAAAVSLVGVVVYAGVLDKVVGAHLHGHPDLPMREIWRVLPIGRLLRADLLLAAATLAGFALFVIPGVVIFTLWSLVGPVIAIENLSVNSAFRRSWRLVRPYFWLTLCIVSVPLYFEQAALHAIHYTELFEHPALPAFLFNGLLGAVIGSVVGLVEVVLAYELIIKAGTDSPLRQGHPA